MALNTRIATAFANLQLDAAAPQADDGYIRIYDGDQPASANTPVSTQTLLAELRFGNPAFGSAANGAIVANAITEDASADASGTAAWCRCLASDGTTVLWDGSIGLSGCNLNLTSTAIQAGARVQVDSLTFTLPLQGA